MRHFVVGFVLFCFLLADLTVANSLVETFVGNLGCEIGCEKKPKNPSQLIGCAIAAKSGENEIDNLVACADRPSQKRCEKATETTLCSWITTPAELSARLGSHICAPRSLVEDNQPLLTALTPWLSMIKDIVFPSYLDIIKCLRHSGKSTCATAKDHKGAVCAPCNNIPETTFPMSPKVSSVCLRNDIAPKACGYILDGPLEDCPKKEKQAETEPAPNEVSKEGNSSDTTSKNEASRDEPSEDTTGRLAKAPTVPNFPEAVLNKLGCDLGCTHKPTTLTQVLACGVGAKLMGDGIAPLINCSKFKNSRTCEAKDNSPQCVWIDMPAALTRSLGFSACLPAQVVTNKATFIAGLTQYQQYLTGLPSYDDIIKCLEQSGDNPAGSCRKTTDSDGQICVFCGGIPSSATCPMKPPPTQLCLHPFLEANSCASLNAAPGLAHCADTDSSPHPGVAFISFFTSLCILLNVTV